MAAVKGRMQAYAVAVAEANVAYSCFINNNGAAGNTTTFPSASTAAVTWGVTGANKRRMILAIPRRGNWPVGRIPLWANSACSANLNMVFLPIVNQLDLLGNLSDVSNTNIDQSATTAWTEAGAATTGAGTDPGHNTDNTVRAIFAWTTSDVASAGVSGGASAYTLADDGTASATWKKPTSGSLAAVMDRADLAAQQAGSDYLYLLVVKEDEGSAGNIQIALLADTTDSHRPKVSGTVHPTPFDGRVLGQVPQLRLPKTNGITCKLHWGSGLTLDSGDSITIEYSDDPADLPAGSPATYAASLASHTFDGSETFGAMATLALTDTDQITADRFTYYRVKSVISGKTNYSATMTAALLVDAGTSFASVDFADGHWQRIANGVAAAATGAAEAIAVQEAVFAKIAALCDGTPENHPRFIKDDGDNVGFTLFSSTATYYPVPDDGSGVNLSGTSIAATDEDDAFQSCWAWIYNNPAPFELSAPVTVPSNHGAFQADKFSANNGGATNVGQWTLDALIDFGFIPPASVITGYSQPTGREGHGNYSFICGDTLNVIVNAGRDSLTSADIDPYPDPPPVTLLSVDDWQWHADNLAWFDALCASKPAKFLKFTMHNTFGGNQFGAPFSAYARSWKKTWRVGYFGDNIAPIIQRDYYDKNMIILPHDHCGDWVREDGLLGIWHACIGDYQVAAENPMSDGFYNDLGSDTTSRYHATDDSNRRGNAQHYVTQHTPTKLSERGVATLISTDDVGTEYLDNASLVTTYGLSDGDDVWALQVPDPASVDSGISPLHPGHPFSLIRRRRLLHG